MPKPVSRVAHNLRLFVGVVAFALAGSSFADAPSFIGLGDLSGGASSSRAACISADGTTVVGTSAATAGTELFRWTQGTGMTSIGAPPSSIAGFGAAAVSGDGSVVVGQTLVDFYWIQGWRWEAGRFVTFGPSGVNDVSLDGSVVIGSSFLQDEAFAWNERTGMTFLGDLRGGRFESEGYGVSADGMTIVGAGSTTVGTEAFRWTARTGMVGLGDLPGGSYYSKATGVSGDGMVVIGSSNVGIGFEAFRWTAATGMVSLGYPPPSPMDSVNPNDVSSDGSVIVGAIGGKVPFIWDAVHGVRLLQDVLIDAGLVEVADWQLIEAFEVSADGTRIVGEGFNPQGQHEGWLAILPRSAPKCIGDLHDDGAVNGLDLAMLLAAWGDCSRGGACTADLSSDGAVDGIDLALLLGAWGACR